MPARTADDDSDWSDDDENSEVETSVLLGVPDGAIAKQDDLDDAAVSRVGGHPAFLPSTEPPISSSQCKNCSFPMELLVQLWCPFEESKMDRALYVFGCSRGECQRKDGSIRGFRSLRYNAKYAAKLEAKATHRREKEAAKAQEREREEQHKAAAKINPFSMNSETAPAGGLFGSIPSFGAGPAMSGLGSQLFGTPPASEEDEEGEDDAPPPPPSDSEAEDRSDGDDSSGDESDESILAAPASAPTASSPWSAAPAYKPLYLSTAYEYVPPPLKAKPSTSAGLDGDAAFGGKSRKAEERLEKEEQAAWNGAMEGYEDSLEVDKVFEHFTRRVGYEGEQCIRYELGGTPLPFAHDTHFTSLFPSPSANRNQSMAPTQPSPRTYDAKSSVVKPCPQCGGKRIFECQLMPHLISVLEHENVSDTTTKDAKPNASNNSAAEDAASAAAEARRKELEQLLKGGEGKEGMGWGTAMIFSCEKDCCLEDGKEARENWAEELVLVQWDE